MTRYIDLTPLSPLDRRIALNMASVSARRRPPRKTHLPLRVLKLATVIGIGAWSGLLFALWLAS